MVDLGTPVTGLLERVLVARADQTQLARNKFAELKYAVAK
jgi:hypothetical protein